MFFAKYRLKPFDAQGVFAPAVPGGGATLRRLAVRGAGMTVLSNGMSLAIQMVATVVLARMLAPRDFGLVTMVTTFSLLLSNFGLNGCTEAVVQREQMDDTTASNLFWITLGGGVLLTLAFAAAGSLLARFYGEPLVARISVALSLTILLSTASVLHLALLKRAMLFPAVAKNDIVAKAASVVVSILFACWGWGYWALVMGACAMPLSTCLGAWYLCRWVPGRPRRAAGTGAMLKFAMYTYGRFSVNYFAHNSDNLLVGWQFGAVALGFYKKAYDLFSLSGSQVTSSTSVVAVAALSRVKDDRPQYIRNLMGAMAVMALLGMAISGDLTLIGKDLIRVLLGPHWGPAGQIFTYFAPGIGVMFLYGAHGWIHLSIGRADRWFRWGIVEWTVTILLFLAGLHWGPQGIAIAWCISFWTLTIPAMWYAGRPIGLGVGPMLRTVWRYVLAAVLACAASAFALSRWRRLRRQRRAGRSAAHRALSPSFLVRCTWARSSRCTAGWRRLNGWQASCAICWRGAGPRTARAKPLSLPSLLLVFALHSSAQTAASQPGPRGVVDWSQTGVGAIPPRSANLRQPEPLGYGGPDQRRAGCVPQRPNGISCRRHVCHYGYDPDSLQCNAARRRR